MDFRILGPFEVTQDGAPLPLGGDKQRALLAALLVLRGEVISRDRLIDQLWGEQPPASADKSVQVYVSRLRKALGDGVLETHGHGYRIQLSPDDVDADRFESMLEEGRRLHLAGEPSGAALVLREALSLWRGPALADFAYAGFAQGEAARLGELRLAALEARVDADLGLGAHVELVPELDALVRAHPLREHLRSQLMLALYRSGRQADALECFQNGRQALVAELGLEPGRELQALEHAILVQDPALDPPRRSRSPMLTVPRRWSARGRLLAGVGCLLLAAAIALAVEVLVSDAGSGGASAVAANELGIADPATGRITGSVSLPGGPARLAAVGASLWVGSDEARTLSAVDTVAGRVTHVVAAGAYPSDLALGAGSLWVVDRERGTLTKVSPAYGTVQRRVHLREGGREPFLHDRAALDPWSVAVGAGSVWVTDGSSRLLQIDPVVGRIVRRIEAGRPLDGVTVTGGSVWAISGARATALRIDPRRAVVTARIAIVSRPGYESPYPIQVEGGAGALWVLNANTATVSRIDPRQRGVVATIPIGVEHGPVRLAVGAGAVWVAGGDGTLSRIDISRNAATSTAVGHALADVAVVRGRVWVSSDPGPGANATVGVAAGPAGTVRPLPGTSCSPVYHAEGANPRYLVVADVPLQGDFQFRGAATAEAIRFAMRDRGFRAGSKSVGLQICDDSTARYGFADPKRCAANARAYDRDASVIGVIGPLNSNCANEQLAILNSARGGPLTIVSPSTTYVGFTRSGPGSSPGEPKRFQPTGTPGYARVVASDDVQGVANAMLAKRLGATRTFLVDDGFDYGRLMARTFRLGARALGLGLVGTAVFPIDGHPDPNRIVRRVRRAHADAIFLGTILTPETARLIRLLRRAFGARLRVLTPDGFLDPRIAAQAGPAAEGMTVSVAGAPVERLRGNGRRFVRSFGRALGAAPDTYAVYAAQATQVLLDAIARSDGTRRSVNQQVFRTRVRNGVLGDFAITPTGDTTAEDVTIDRVTGGRLKLFTVVRPPSALMARLRGGGR